MEYIDIPYETESFEQRLAKILIYRELQKEGFYTRNFGVKAGYVVPNYEVRKRIAHRVRDEGGLLEQIMRVVEDICDDEDNKDGTHG